MIRTPIARRTELKRGKSLRRKTWMRQRRATPRRSERVYDAERRRWARRQPCAVRIDPPDPNRLTTCSGRVEADHMGDRAAGRKASDDTCVGLCRQHHRERTDHSGAFFELDKEQLRAWRERAIARTQADWKRMNPDHVKAPQTAAEGTPR